VFIRYNAAAKIWEYDSTTSATERAGDVRAVWLPLPISYSQIYNPPTIPPPYTLPANVALIDAVKTWSAPQAFAEGSLVGGTQGSFTFIGNSLSANQKVWNIINNGGNFRIRALNDAQNAESGNIEISRTGLIFAPSGIYFPNRSTGPTVLDYYEEGGWAPVLAASNGGAVVTYGEQTGYYIRIGQLVVLTYSVNLATATWGAGGYLFLAGLPFTCAGVHSMGYLDYYSVVPNMLSLQTHLPPGAASCYFIGKTSASNTAHQYIFTVADVTAGSHFRGTIVYRVLD